MPTPLDAETRRQNRPIRPALAAALNRARALCAATGERLTPAREAVLTLLIEAEEPISAYTLLDQLKAKRGGATPPTIYRALNFLRELGLAHRIERLNAFVACTDAHDHKHAAEFLICLGCGSVAEIEDSRISEAVRAAACRTGFQPAAITVEVEGLCGACADSAPGGVVVENTDTHAS